MSQTLALTSTQLSATTTFQSMSNLMASSVSSAQSVPQGASRIVTAEITSSADGSDEYCLLVRITGNGIENEQYICGGANVASTTATGTAMNYIMKEVDFPVTPGNVIEVGLAVTDAATISAAVVLTFA